MSILEIKSYLNDVKVVHRVSIEYVTFYRLPTLDDNEPKTTLYCLKMHVGTRL